MKTQKEWGWKIALGLFLCGAGAGAYLVGVFTDIIARDDVAQWGIMLGFPIVFVGSLFLLADLGVKWKAPLAFLNPVTSWISKGIWLISIFCILGIIHIGALIWPFRWLEHERDIRIALGVVNSFFAFWVIIYSAILLTRVKPIRIWSNGLLPILFLLSSVASGLMIVTLVCLFVIEKDDVFTLSTVFLTCIIALEAIVLCFYLLAGYQDLSSRPSVEVLIKGDLVPEFWIGVAVWGLLFPFGLGIMHMLWPWAFASGWTIIIGHVTGLFGEFLLRYVVIYCGVKTPIRVGVVEVEA